MYSVSVREKFIARHFLPHEIGREQTPHSHHYFVEVRVYGEKLDRKGFLMDIVTLRHALDTFLRQLNDTLLNDLELGFSYMRQERGDRREEREARSQKPGRGTLHVPL